MSKTLVIILSETRAHEITFNNFKENVIDRLGADLCLCIGVKPDYDYDNPFYKLSKYKFLYKEPEDFGDAFDYAYNIITQNRPKYECVKNSNSLYGLLGTPQTSNKNITYYGNDLKSFKFNDCDDDEVVVHAPNFPNQKWTNQIYGIHKSNNNNNKTQEHVDTYKKGLHWREFLKIKDQFMGGVSDDKNQHPGSAGILIFFRWFLLKNLQDNGLINKYDRFVITRSDFVYQLPHPKLNAMSEKNIWIPDGEYYTGYTDRHAVLSKHNIKEYLNIFNNFVLRSNDYFIKMTSKQNWNLEALIHFHLKQNNVIQHVKHMPYIMYSARNINGTTRWAGGNFSEKLGYYIKYDSEYKKSSEIKEQFEQQKINIDIFFKKYFSKK